MLEYVFAPIGFNWQISIALVPGLAAREVAVGALGTVYAMSAAGDDVAGQLEPVIASTWSLATGLFAAGLVRVRAAVPVDAGRGQARNQLVALSAHHGGLSVRAGLPGLVHHLPRRRGLGVRSRPWRSKSSSPSSSSSRSRPASWKLMPARRRLRVLLALDGWAARHPRLARWRERFAEATHRARRGHRLRRLRRERRRPAASRRRGEAATPRAAVARRRGVFCCCAVTARGCHARGARRRRRRSRRVPARRAASCRWLRAPPPCCMPPVPGTAWSAPSRTATNPPRPARVPVVGDAETLDFEQLLGAASHRGRGGGGRRAARAHRSHPRAGHSRVPGARDPARADARIAAPAGRARRHRGGGEPRGRRARRRARGARRALPQPRAGPRAVPDLGPAYLHDRRQARDHRRAAVVRRRAMSSRISRPRRPRSRARRRCCAIPS